MLRKELEQIKTQYDSDMEVLKKRNDSLLEDCERSREVGSCLLLVQRCFLSFRYLVGYSFHFKLCCSDCVVINIFNCLS